MGEWVGGYLTLHPAYLPTYLATDLPTYIYTYLPTYLTTITDITFSGSFPSYVPHPTFSGSHWSSFRYELKSVLVHFDNYWSPFRSVSVPIEVRFGIFVGPFQFVSVRFSKSWHCIITMTRENMSDQLRLTQPAPKLSKALPVFLFFFSFFILTTRSFWSLCGCAHCYLRIFQKKTTTKNIYLGGSFKTIYKQCIGGIPLTLQIRDLNSPVGDHRSWQCIPNRNGAGKEGVF